MKQSGRKNERGSPVAAVILLVLLFAAALVITIGVGSDWFTNDDVSTWFNSWRSYSEDDGGDTDVSHITILNAKIVF